MPTDPTDTAGSADQDRITGSAAPTPPASDFLEPRDCTLCGHNYEAHEWWRDVPTKYVPCPECPDGLCLDPQPQEAKGA